MKPKNKKMFGILKLILLLSFMTNLFAYSSIDTKQDIAVYKDCLEKNYYKKLVELEKQYNALKNENFNNYTLKGRDPKDKTQNKFLETFCKATEGIKSALWISPICEAYHFGRAYSKKADKTVMDGVRILPSRGVNGVYRTYLNTHKNECDTGYPPPDNLINLPSEAQKYTNFIKLLMVKGWKDYCNKLKNVKNKIVELENKCVEVPNVIGENLLDACAYLTGHELFRIYGRICFKLPASSEDYPRRSKT